MEGVDWVYDVASSTWTTANAFDRIEEEIKEIAKVDPRKLEEQAAVIFEKFIKSLSKT
jgi:ABC-type glycerol-3-phosphate transport system permease component